MIYTRCMKNSTLVIGAVVILAVIVIFVIVGGRSDTVVMVSPTVSTSSSTSVSASPSSSAKVAPRVSSSPSVAQNLSYNQALDKYGSTTRIQFGMYCDATPNRMVIKTGTTIMLDNRAGEARTISLDTNKYLLAGYGFKLVSLTSTVPTRTIIIDCGSAQNVGQIIVQK